MNQLSILKSVCVVVIGLFSLSAQSSPPIHGWLEGVFVDGIDTRLRAKLDSGALTSSIHGEKPRVFQREGKPWLRFDFYWHKGAQNTWVGPYTVEAPLVRKVYIKDHEDDSQPRYVVNLHFSLHGECHVAEFSVADRSGFNYALLLGRRFLAGKVLIDPRKTFTKATDKSSACKPISGNMIPQRVLSRY